MRCKFCQYENPPGMRFCGNCGNLLQDQARGTYERQDNWFERGGRRRVLGRTLGESGFALVVSLVCFLVVSSALWLIIRSQQGRLPWLQHRQAAKVDVPAQASPHPKRYTHTIHKRPIVPAPKPTVPEDPIKIEPKQQPAPVLESRNYEPPPPSAVVPAPPPDPQSKQQQPPSPVYPPPSEDASPPPETHERAPVPEVAPAPAPVTPTGPPPYSGARQGDLIWSGQLPKGQLLVINGMQPAWGSLRGDRLPGVPVTLKIEPADVIVALVPSSFDRHQRFALRSASTRNVVVRIHWEVLPAF